MLKFFFPNFYLYPIRTRIRGSVAFSARLGGIAESWRDLAHNKLFISDLPSDGRGLVGPSHFEIRLSAVANFSVSAFARS